MTRKTTLTLIIATTLCLPLLANPDLVSPLTPWYRLSMDPTFAKLPVSIASVAVVCELRGYNQATFAPGMQPQTFVTKGAPPNLLLLPLQLVRASDGTPEMNGTAKLLMIDFTAGDFQLNPPGLDDPNSVTEAWCRFALRGIDGTLYEPKYDPGAIRAEIDSARLVRGYDYTGPIPLIQPPASAWPPLLAPRLDATYAPFYRWHTAYLFPVPQWARPLRTDPGLR